MPQASFLFVGQNTSFDFIYMLVVTKVFHNKHTFDAHFMGYTKIKSILMWLIAFCHSQAEVGPGDDVEVSLAGAEVAVVHECNSEHRSRITPCGEKQTEVTAPWLNSWWLKKKKWGGGGGGGGGTHGQCFAVSVAVPCVCATFFSPRHLFFEALSLLYSNRPYVVSVDVKHKQSGPFILFSA